ncbi:hypothetical protein L873DRAFT_1840257 [Choiromyces venosus 120613-1]|uniref:F-box domain-containing protein n=1 Tax=Choiromyces venosus 120613-1 TaxID=1336337 RepID=A0A3N4K693_9PEZI|nr:hypothetical protein L873DRAFT_1840257 [Choiromyces venosus 120613-1]
MSDKRPPSTDSSPPTKRVHLLPPEILSLIIRHLSPQDILSFSRTNHYHYTFTSSEAWRIYLQTHLPTAHAQILQEHHRNHHHQHEPQYRGLSTNWVRWAEEATRVSRNFSRAGFIATALKPEIYMYVPRGPRRGPGGGQLNALPWEPGSRGVGGGRRQTVAYHPMIDAYGEFCGDRDVLAIGAGQDIMVSKGRGQRGTLWWGFENREERGGRDDVTGLHLLRPYEKVGNKDVEVALVGRANGRLEMLELDTRGRFGVTSKPKVVVRYHTDGRMVKGMDMIHKGNGGGVLIGAILNNSSLSIYNVRQPASVGESVRLVREASEVQFVDEQPWEVSFLDHTKVAVGKSSAKPIAIHTITPSGLTQEPIREFLAKDWGDMKSVSVYAIKPLPKSSTGASANGDVFLSGCWDGIARLHDLRTPEPAVAQFRDPIGSQTPIFSLLPLSSDTFMTGVNQYGLLKYFDIRSAFSPASPPKNWATYIQTRSESDRTSPVHSLALGGGGKTVYAGLQGRVWALDLWGKGVGRRDGVREGLSMYVLQEPMCFFTQGRSEESAMGVRARAPFREWDARWRFVESVREWW